MIKHMEQKMNCAVDTLPLEIIHNISIHWDAFYVLLGTNFITADIDHALKLATNEHVISCIGDLAIYSVSGATSGKYLSYDIIVNRALEKKEDTSNTMLIKQVMRTNHPQKLTFESGTDHAIEITLYARDVLRDNCTVLYTAHGAEITCINQRYNTYDDARDAYNRLFQYVRDRNPAAAGAMMPLYPRKSQKVLNTQYQPRQTPLMLMVIMITPRVW